MESAIDEDVKPGIEQINTILKATRGRFNMSGEDGSIYLAPITIN